MEHSTYTLTGTINHIAHHRGKSEFHLDTTIADREALAKDVIHKCTFIIKCHIHDPEYIYHLKPWTLNQRKTPDSIFIIEKTIALPTCKYTSSYQEAKDTGSGSGCGSEHKDNQEKIFHIVHEEVCIYVCIYIYICMCIYLYVCVYVYKYTCICIYMCVGIYMCMYIYVYVYIYVYL